MRRPTGSLEAEVLAALWASEDGATPGEVHGSMGEGLAYTTVMTILTRLWRKDLVERERRGRAYVYRPIVSEAELAAQRMLDQLDRVGDREAALNTFVGTLGKEDSKALRKILSRRTREA